MNRLSGGVFAVSRGIFDDPDFLPEPFTQREAFMWLVASAAWKEYTVRGARGRVTLQRGEFCFSIRFLADKWKWSKSRVARFISMLENRDTIRDTGRDGEQVYIINKYNDFQKVSLPSRDTERDTKRDASGTAAGHERDKEEDRIKQDKTLNNIIAAPKGARRDYPDDFETVWSAYPKREGSNPKEPACKAYLKAIKAGASHEEILCGVRAYAASTDCKPNTPYVPQAATFFNEKRWKDYQPVHDPPAKPQVFVPDKTRAFEAWERHKGKRLSAFSEHNGQMGRWFDTEFPPSTQAE